MALADSVVSNFESFDLGTVNGQDAWTATGPNYDQEVVSNTYGFTEFGDKSLRISDCVTSGSFGDWVFAKPVLNAAGDSDATAGAFDVGERQTRFEAEFDIASALPGKTQGGLHISVSPDRGDGSRMSYVVFEDTMNGLDVTFYDVVGTTSPVSFVPVVIANDLSRSVPHNIKFVMDFVDGPSNDVVEVYIDGALVHTGSSWEDYYRFDNEAQAEQSPRLVKTLIFQARSGNYNYDGASGHTHNCDHGFLIDNVVLESSAPSAEIEPTPGEGTLEVRKVVLLGDGNECFDITVGESEVCLANGESTGEIAVEPGVYTITEEVFGGYYGSIICRDGNGIIATSFLGNVSVDVEVEDGADVTCTIYNTRFSLR